MKKRHLIPFKFLPGSWGLSGKTYEKAKAEYELDGHELGIKLAEIEYGKDSYEYKFQLLSEELHEDKIDSYEFDKKVLEIRDDLSEEEKKKKLLKVDLDYKKITQNEHDKELATIDKQPWVRWLDTKIDPNNPTKVGGIELDWNQYFIDELKKEGYTGPSEELIMTKWFNLLCESIAHEGGFKKPNNPPQVPPEPGKREYT